MARPQNIDLFDAYFRRVELDHDCRINGNEALVFFQGANLPKQILAQIWRNVDQNGTGFLGRAQFYIALKLVTVAQSGREFTPDIVRAALFGPVTSQIPAPQIAVPPSPVLPPAGIRGPTVQPGVATGQQHVPPANNQFLRPVSLQTIPISEGKANACLDHGCILVVFLVFRICLDGF